MGIKTKPECLLPHKWKYVFRRKPGSLTYSMVECTKCGKIGWRNG